MIEDTIKVAKKIASKIPVEKVNQKNSILNFQESMEILKIIIWPIIALIVVLILRKSIIKLIDRINKIGFGSVGAEATQQKQENVDNGLFETGKLGSNYVFENEKKVGNENEIIDRTLGMFSQATIEKAIQIVNKETQVKEISEDKDKISTLYRYSQALYLILSFEKIYNIIFGSQLYILERVNTTSNETKESLKIYYDNAQRASPEFYSTYAYDDYFNFLVSNELIIADDSGNYGITWLGRDFLKYIVENGKAMHRKY